MGPIGSVEFISTGLAVLLFYIFPLLVALIEAVLDRAWPATHRLLALACAFAGLATMLGASFGTSDPLGMALALAGAAAVSVNTVGIVRLVGRVNPLVSMFHMVVSATVTLVILTLADRRRRAPRLRQRVGGVVRSRRPAVRIPAPLLRRHIAHRGR